MDLDRKQLRAAAVVAAVVVVLGGLWLVMRPASGDGVCSVRPSITDRDFEDFRVQPYHSCEGQRLGAFRMECWVVHKHTFGWESHRSGGLLGLSGNFTFEGTDAGGVHNSPYGAESYTGTIGDRYKPRCELRLADGRRYTGEGYSVKL